MTLTKKIFAFLIGLLTFSLSYSGTKALFTLFMMSIFESVNERVFRNIDGIGSILGLIGGIVVANYVYKGILNGKQTGSLWRRSLTAILIIIILIIGSIVYLAKGLGYLADF